MKPVSPRAPRLALAALCLLSVAAGAAGARPAGAPPTVITVGAGAGCDFAELQTAIDSASTQAQAVTEIRLSADRTGAELVIENRNLSIDGRWPTCTSSQPQSGLRRVLAAAGGHRVGRVLRQAAGLRTVRLRGLMVRDGSAGTGGGLLVSGAIDATLDDVLVGSNVAVGAGGGLAVDAARVVLDGGTIIGAVPSQGLAGNVTQFIIGGGGGIRCALGAELVVADARIRGNQSARDGGGILAEDCTVRIQPSPAFTDFTGVGDGYVTLFENSATFDGGGLHASDGADVLWQSDPPGAFGGRAVGNRAGFSGGAIHLGEASSLVATWIRIEDSRADERGGAIAAVGTDTTLTLAGGPTLGCSGSGGSSACPGIFGTRGIAQGDAASLIGGAVSAQGGAVVRLEQQHLYDNWARNGSAVHAADADTQVTLENALVARNILYAAGNSNSTIESTNGARVVLAQATMAGNFRASLAFPGVEPALSSIRTTGATSSVAVRNSLLWNDAVLLVRRQLGADVSASCVLGHENASLAPAQIADPLYVDTTGTSPDFRLQSGSPAIDRCGPEPGLTDVFGTPRPTGTGPDRGGQLFLYDAGAVEMPVDLLFADDFELAP